MKKISAHQWAAVLYASLAAAKEKEWPAVLAAFVAEIKRAHATRAVPHIIRAFTHVHDDATGTVRIHTTGARELSPAAQKKFAALADNVIIDHTVAPATLGGVCVRVGDTIIDGTLRRRLQSLL